MCNSLNQSQMCKTQWSCLIFTGHLKFVLLSLDSMTRYTKDFSFGTAPSATSSEYLYLHLKLYLFAELHKLEYSYSLIDYPAINRREWFSNVLWSCEILFCNMIYIVQVSLISILVIVYSFDIVASLYLKMELCDAFLTLSNQAQRGTCIF